MASKKKHSQISTTLILIHWRDYSEMVCRGLLDFVCFLTRIHLSKISAKIGLFLWSRFSWAKVFLTISSQCRTTLTRTHAVWKFLRIYSLQNRLTHWVSYRARKLFLQGAVQNKRHVLNQTVNMTWLWRVLNNFKTNNQLLYHYSGQRYILWYWLLKSLCTLPRVLDPTKGKGLNSETRMLMSTRLMTPSLSQWISPRRIKSWSVRINRQSI